MEKNKPNFLDIMDQDLEKENRIRKSFRLRYEILTPLLPLHISIQAFFGISKDDKGKWKRLPADLTEEVRNEYSELFSQKNQQIAFLLDKEAGWDFFSEIGIKLTPDASTSGDFQNWHLPELLDELLTIYINSPEVINLVKTSKELVGNQSLRSLCAILANVVEDGKINPLIDNTNQDLSQHSKAIEKSIRFFKNENQGKPRHSKWPSDIEGEGNYPAESYKNLVKQLNEWNNDGRAAFEVIDTIEILSQNLQKINSYLEKEKRQRLLSGSTQ